jgi:hypothetical protein
MADFLSIDDEFSFLARHFKEKESCKKAA